MLTWILLFASIAALVASLYKDRKIEADTPTVKRALRINIAVQVVVAVLATYNVVQTERDARELRVAQNDKEILVEVSRLQIPILDNYSVLMQTASAVRNYSEYQRAFEQLPPQLQFRPWEIVAPPTQVGERDAARAAFGDLQRMSREVLALQLRYGERVPGAIAEWAAITSALKFEQIPIYARATPEGLQYVSLLGNGIGVSVAKLQAALRRLEQ